MEIEIPEKDKEATLFAFALLMPEEFLRKEIGKIHGGDIIDNDIDIVDYIAKKFQVTVTVASIRLKQLGYLEEK